MATQLNSKIAAEFHLRFLKNEPRLSIVQGSAGPQPLSIFMTEVFVKSFMLFMW